MKRYSFDTNALIRQPHLLLEADEVYIHYVVLEELDRIKTRNDATGFGAREAVRKIKLLNNVIFDSEYDRDEKLNDNVIIKSALKNNTTLVTGDYLVQLKAESFGIDIFPIDEDLKVDNAYTGVKEIFIDPSFSTDQELLAKVYESPEVNTFDLVQNQYLVFWDLSKPTYDLDGNIKGYDVIDKFKFDKGKISKLKYKAIDNMFTGKIKPRNVKQELMFDMMQDKSTTVKTAFGGFGVGKDFVMISHAIDLLYANKVKKLVWVRNNVEVKDSNPIGFLPSDLESKLMPFAMPLADHLGGIDGMKSFLDGGKIEIQHLGFIRGRDIKDSIVYVSECENNTKQHIQLLLGRIGEGSQLWLNGDTRQIDNDKYIHNNGVSSLKRLKGHNLYGQVTLDKTEQSETAKLADLLD
jgi:PhoH-like ATPase